MQSQPLGTAGFLCPVLESPWFLPGVRGLGFTAIRAHQVPCAHSSSICLYGLATAQTHICLLNGLNRSIAPLVMGLITRRLLRAPARGHRHSSSSRSQPWSHTGSRTGSGAATDQQPRGSTQPQGELSDPSSPRGNQLRA